MRKKRMKCFFKRGLGYFDKVISCTTFLVVVGIIHSDDLIIFSNFIGSFVQ